MLLAPSNIANQAALQAAALRRHGHDAQAWHFGETKFGFTSDVTRDWARDPDAALALLAEVAGGGYDVIHFHAARSFVPPSNPLGELWDLPLWRRLGVRTVMSFHGTEIRDASLEKSLDPWSYYHFGAPSNDPVRVARRLEQIRGSVDCMTVSNPANFTHVPDANYLPLIVDVDAFTVGAPPTRTVPVIAHAPSLRATKGTDDILAALAALRDEGLKFEVDLIEGVDNNVATARMADADIVIEKILGDGYGVTALEGWATGRAVVTRMTARTTDLVPGFPGVSADPTSIATVLRDLIASPARRAELGARGREYVAREHSGAAVVTVLERLYGGGGVVEPNQPAQREPAEYRDALDLQERELASLRRERDAALAATARERRAREEAQRSFGYRVRRRLRRALASRR